MNGKDPLTPEERELARLLAPDGEAMPSPTLDARILAAARAELGAAAPAAPAAPVASVATPGRRPAAPIHRPRRRRWPAALGLAASVTLAIGVAWQLREPPRPEAAVAAHAGADAAPPGIAATDASQAKAPGREADAVVSSYAAAPTAAPLEDAPAAPPAEAESPAPVATARTRAAVAQKPSVAAAKQADAAAGAERAARFEAPPFMPPSPPAPPAPPAPASIALPPAPPAPRADSAAPSTVAAERRAAMAVARPAPVTAAPAPPPPPPVLEVGDPASAAADVSPSSAHAPQAAADAEKASTAPVAEEAVDEDAARWLQRIRLQRDQGDLEGARASLARFVRSHPGLAVPEDLRPLLASPP